MPHRPHLALVAAALTPILCPAVVQAATAATDTPIALAEFTVSSSRENGWRATNTLAGTRTNVGLLDLPRSVSVLTSEFIDDLGAITVEEAIPFVSNATVQAGYINIFDNSAFYLRGFRTQNIYRNGAKLALGAAPETAVMERVEVLKGPASLLAGVSEPGGSLNYLTKRPQRTQRTRVQATYGDDEFFSAGVDATGRGLVIKPLPKLALFASYSESFSGTPTNRNAFGNPLDEPVGGEGIDLGAKAEFFDGKLTFSAALFEIERTNVVRQLTQDELRVLLNIPFPAPVPTDARFTQDAGQENKGYELELGFRPNANYQLAFNYGYVDAVISSNPQFPATVGQRAPEVGEVLWSAFHKYTFTRGPLRNLSLTNGITYVDGKRRFTLNNATGGTEFLVPGYTRYDVGASYRTRLFERETIFSAKCYNVTDEQYFGGRQSKGRPRYLRFSVETAF
jgi:outer membrane receptor protein involved in Fe transport